MMDTLFPKLKAGLQQFLYAQPQELPFLLLLLLTYFLFNMGCDMVDAVAEMLFVHRVGVEQLPTLFAISPFAIVLTLLFMGKVLDRVSRTLFFFGITIVFILILALTYLFISRSGTSIYYLFHVLQRIFFVVSSIVFWLIANDLVDIEQAKRLFTPVIAAGIGGKLLGNLLTAAVVAAFAPESIFLLATGLFAGCSGLILWLRRLNIPNPDMTAAGMNRGMNPHAPTEESISFLLPQRLLRLPFVQAFIWLTVIVSVGETVLRYQFTSILNQSAQTEQSLIIIYSLFKTGAGTLALLFQLFGVGYFLRHLSIAGSLNVQPVATVGGLFLISLMPQLLMVTSVFGILFMLHFGLYTTGRRIMVNIFPTDERGRFSAFTKQLVYLGKLLGALFLFLVANHVSLVTLSWLAMGLIATWLFFLPRFGQSFEQARLEMQGLDSRVKYHESFTIID